MISEDATELSEEARTALEAALIAGFEQALATLAEARAGEGRMLAGVLGEFASASTP